MTKVRKSQMATGTAPLENRIPLKREDVMCPICWSILIEPVTLPCKHNLCQTCCRKHLMENALACPCCRRRLSVWSRKASKENNLVNVVYWERIQREFPKLVYAKLNNQNSQDLEPNDVLSTEDDKGDLRGESRMELDMLMSTPPAKRDGENAAQGEIRQEYEHLYKDHFEDLENQRKLEAEASSEFIRKIQEEETQKEREELNKLEADAEYAKRLQMEEEARLKALANSKRSSMLEVDNMVKKPLCRNLLSEWGGPSIPNQTIALSPNSPSTDLKSTSQLSNGSHTPTSSSCLKRRSSSNHSNKSKTVKRTGKSNSQSSILNFFSNSQDVGAPNGPSPQPSTSAAAIASMSSSNLTSSFVAVAGNSSGTIVSPFKSILSSPNSKLDLSNMSPDKSINLNQPAVTFADQLNVPSGRGTPDSIHVELNSHFRPIRSAPKTPPKRLADGTYLPEPKIVKTTPIRPSPKFSSSVIAPIHNSVLGEVLEKSDLDIFSVNDSDTMSIIADASSGNQTPYKGVGIASVDVVLDAPSVAGGSQDDKASCSNSNDLQKPSAKLEAIVEANEAEIADSASVSSTLPDCMDAYEYEAKQLEKFRLQKEQEKADFEVALALEKELNKRIPAKITRGKNSKERYSIRNWLKPKEEIPGVSATTVSKSTKNSSIAKDKKSSPRKTNKVAISSATVTISKKLLTPKKEPEFKIETDSVPSPLANIVNSHSINNNLSPYSKRDLRSNSKI